MMGPRRRGAMVGSWQGRRECPYRQIRARLRTPPGADQRGPTAQCFIVKGLSICDQLVERAADIGLGDARREAAVLADEDEPQLAPGRLFVPLERLPDAHPVYPDGLRREDLLDEIGRASREPQSCQQPERDRSAVADGIVL